MSGHAGTCSTRRALYNAALLSIGGGVVTVMYNDYPGTVWCHLQVMVNVNFSCCISLFIPMPMTRSRSMEEASRLGNTPPPGIAISSLHPDVTPHQCPPGPYQGTVTGLSCQTHIRCTPVTSTPVITCHHRLSMATRNCKLCLPAPVRRSTSGDGCGCTARGWRRTHTSLERH